MRKRKIRSDTVEGSSLPINLNNQIIIIIIMITRLYPPGPHHLCFSSCRQSSTSLSLSSRKCKWPIPLCHGWWVVFCCCCCCCPDNSHLAHNKAARYHNHRTHAYCLYLCIVGISIRPRDERHNNGNDNDYVMAVEIEQWKRATNDYIRLILGWDKF